MDAFNRFRVLIPTTPGIAGFFMALGMLSDVLGLPTAWKQSLISLPVLAVL